MGTRSEARLAGALLALLVLAAWVPTVRAQPEATANTSAAPSAADKATARLTATEGIELYREQRFAEALDRMKRAQELFDAPVHLLYIARCQRELGALVEAAEVYRALSRTQLGPDAPDAFRSAVADGGTELSQLEPKIPRLVLRIAPLDAPDLQIQLDGQPVPAAVVGIERPLNPGQRSLRVTADGYQPEERSLEVREEATVEVAVKLKPAKQTAEAAATPPEADVSSTDEADVNEDDHHSPLSSVALLLGARLGVGIPAGRVPGAVLGPGREGDVRLPALANPGGELELRLGAHFFDMWGIFAFLNAQALGDDDREFTRTGAGGAFIANNPSSPSVSSLGLAVLGGTPRGQFGGFAELGFVLFRRVTMATEANVSGAGGLLTASCNADITATGNALRLSAGLNVPLRRRLLHLTPYASVHVGGVSTVDTSAPECSFDESRSVGDSPTFSVISLGVGGEFFFGGND